MKTPAMIAGAFEEMVVEGLGALLRPNRLGLRQNRSVALRLQSVATVGAEVDDEVGTVPPQHRQRFRASPACRR